MSFLPYLVYTSGGILIGLFIALAGMVTASPSGRFQWPPKWPARYPAPRHGQARKGLRDICGVVRAWLLVGDEEWTDYCRRHGWRS